MKLKTVGYPFIRTEAGLFNPEDSPLRNARNKILNLLCTNKGLRILSHNCLFGINIHNILFLNIRYGGFLKQLEKLVAKTIKRWVKEVLLVLVEVTQLLHSIRISIKYKVMDQKDILNLEFDLLNVE